MKNVELHVGYERATTRARFVAAIRRAESGDITPQSHVTFESWNGLSRVLSAKRIELLRHVHRTPAATIADVARALGRDYKRVPGDVEILAAAGLLDRTAAGGVHALYDEIRTVIHLSPAA